MIVAICLDRSPQSIISTLAVLKSGGAFLPLDPNHPVERINFMLGHAKPAVVITTTAFGSSLATGPWTILDPDADEFTGNIPASATATNVSHDQLAYVIYTSGSTGEPKAVEVTIGNLFNLITWHQLEFGVTASDRA